MSLKKEFHTTHFTTKDSSASDVLHVPERLRKVKILELEDGGGKTLQKKNADYTVNKLKAYKNR